MARVVHRVESEWQTSSSRRVATGSCRSFHPGVAAASLRVTRFYYRHVCGNHIVWDASNVLADVITAERWYVRTDVDLRGQAAARFAAGAFGPGAPARAARAGRIRECRVAAK